MVTGSYWNEWGQIECTSSGWAVLNEMYRSPQLSLLWNAPEDSSFGSSARDQMGLCLSYRVFRTSAQWCKSRTCWHLQCNALGSSWTCQLTISLQVGFGRFLSGSYTAPALRPCWFQIQIHEFTAECRVFLESKVKNWCFSLTRNCRC